MKKYRTEHDSMGNIEVPEGKFWGAQTQRSLNNFAIGQEKIPHDIIRAFGYLKKGAALANCDLGVLAPEKADAIVDVCNEIIAGKLKRHFPLAVWQTGSGTHTNMNVNEVIAYRANQKAGYPLLHPNDDVNCSQSSNDTFPTAMHLAAVAGLQKRLIPALRRLIGTLRTLENKYAELVKCGRTHLQDAVPITFGQEISGWRAMLENNYYQLDLSMLGLRELALGGTAVGTGLNAPKEFDKQVAAHISILYNDVFVAANNKFSALAAKDEFVFAHGALKALAANMMKLANDIRWLASGPRTGLGEIAIPQNEPGSSIMPGKVNPTQCEAVTMVAVQVMGNDATIGMAASQGNFELNVFLPVIAYNYLQSLHLLTDCIKSFERNCVRGIIPNVDKMRANVDNSLMLVTALSPHIGYARAAKVAQKAYADNTDLRSACLALGYLDAATFDSLVVPEAMTHPLD